jgi:phosphoesterase RecJ-like protein
MSLALILQKISQHKTFIVATHVNPDPDALASQLAMAIFLKALGKKVILLAEEIVPQRYAFLPSAGLIKKVDPKKKIAYDAAIIVDCGDLSRVGAVKKILQSPKAIINIDHHITNDFFGTINHVVPQASSTAEIIFDVLEQAKFKLDKKVATLLYLGIMTDTGSFRFENTTSRTHQVVSCLLKFNLPVNTFYQRLYETVPLSDLKSFTKLVSNFHSHFDGKVVTLQLRQSVVKKFSKEFDLRDKIFSYLRTIKGVEVIAILTEHGKNKTRVNLRSQGKVDVARLAAAYDGGGHSRASGCVVGKNMLEATEIILNDLNKLFKKKTNA